MKTLDAHLRESEEAARQHEADVEKALAMIQDGEALRELWQGYEPDIWGALGDLMWAHGNNDTKDVANLVTKIELILFSVALHEVKRRNDQ